MLPNGLSTFSDFFSGTVLHMHRDIDIDIDRVMRSFTLGKSRHIDFGYGL
jgi:hypothetical protein